MTSHEYPYDITLSMWQIQVLIKFALRNWWVHCLWVGDFLPVTTSQLSSGEDATKLELISTNCQREMTKVKPSLHKALNTGFCYTQQFTYKRQSSPHFIEIQFFSMQFIVTSFNWNFLPVNIVNRCLRNATFPLIPGKQIVKFRNFLWLAPPPPTPTRAHIIHTV